MRYPDPKRAPRKSVSRFMFKMIKDGKLYRQKGKGKAGEVVARVLKEFPNSKFNVGMYLWYRSRYRRQMELGLTTSYLVKIPTRFLNMNHKRRSRWPLVARMLSAVGVGVNR